MPIQRDLFVQTQLRERLFGLAAMGLIALGGIDLIEKPAVWDLGQAANRMPLRPPPPVIPGQTPVSSNGRSGAQSRLCLALDLRLAVSRSKKPRGSTD